MKEIFNAYGDSLGFISDVSDDYTRVADEEFIRRSRTTQMSRLDWYPTEAADILTDLGVDHVDRQQEASLDAMIGAANSRQIYDLLRSPVDGYLATPLNTGGVRYSPTTAATTWRKVERHASYGS